MNHREELDENYRARIKDIGEAGRRAVHFARKGDSESALHAYEGMRKLARIIEKDIRSGIIPKEYGIFVPLVEDTIRRIQEEVVKYRTAQYLGRLEDFFPGSEGRC